MTAAGTSSAAAVPGAIAAPGAAAAPAFSLEDLRREAWELFLRTPDPAKTVETWRRVRFGAWRLQELAASDCASSGAVEPGGRASRPTPGIALEGRDAVFRQVGNDPRPLLELSAEAAGKGVVLLSLEDAAARYPDKVGLRPAAPSADAGADFRKLEAANRARFRGGAFLLIPRGVRLERPVEIAFEEGPDGSFSFPRVLVAAEEGSEASIVEEHLGTGGASRRSVVAFSQLALAPNARIRYFYHQEQSPGSAHFWHQSVELRENAELRHYSALLGAGVHKSQLDVRLSGPGARSELYGIFLGTGDQVFDPHTTQDHRAPRTSSDLLYRGALASRARSIYTGLIRIEKEARGSEAYQQNNNVLLSNDARADSTPVLEILTDEVRCKHGATVGPLDADVLFYLESRGLAPEEAARMVLLGLFGPVLDRLPLEALRERTVAALEARLSA